MNTEQAISAAIAHDIWDFIQAQKQIRLMPTNTNPIEIAHHKGFEETVSAFERFFISKAEEHHKTYLSS